MELMYEALQTMMVFTVHLEPNALHRLSVITFHESIYFQDAPGLPKTSVFALKIGATENIVP